MSQWLIYTKTFINLSQFSFCLNMIVISIVSILIFNIQYQGIAIPTIITKYHNIGHNDYDIDDDIDCNKAISAVTVMISTITIVSYNITIMAVIISISA